MAPAAECARGLTVSYFAPRPARGECYNLLNVSSVANRGLYSTLVLLLHFFTWERQPLQEEQKEHVFPPFRAARECSLEMDALADTATPTEAQAIPWSAGIKFHCRDQEDLHTWLASPDH